MGDVYDSITTWYAFRGCCAEVLSDQGAGEGCYGVCDRYRG